MTKKVVIINKLYNTLRRLKMTSRPTSSSFSYRPTSQHTIFFCLILINAVELTSAGYCNKLHVDDAEYQYSIEGSYYLTYAECSGQPIWTQTYSSNGIYVSGWNYITYVSNNVYIINSTNNTEFSGWVIGPYSCPAAVASAQAISKQNANTLPYNIGEAWYEKYINGNQFYPSPDLEVTCSNDLNGWQIFGIVMGSICALMLILALLACCCSKHRPKKSRSRTAPAAVVYTTGGIGETCTVVTTSSSSRGQPMGDNLYTEPVYIINPPPYDNSDQPPAYAIIGSGTPGLPPINEVVDEKAKY